MGGFIMPSEPKPIIDYSHKQIFLYQKVLLPLLIGFAFLVIFLILGSIGYISIKSYGFNILWILPIGFISWIVGHFLLKDI